MSGYFDRLTNDVLAGGKLPPLVKFPVIGQIDLGHNAQQHSAMDDHAAIIEVSPVTNGAPTAKTGKRSRLAEINRSSCRSTSSSTASWNNRSSIA